MRSGIIAVWDRDPEYAERLSEYLRRQKSLSVAAAFYSDPEELRRAVEAGRIGLVVTGQSLAGREWLRGTARVILSEEKENCGAVKEKSAEIARETREAAEGEATVVYKYQSAYEILRVVQGCRQILPATACRRAEARLRAVYSPLGGCLKTSLGLVMGRILAEERSSLFVSLEAHSGFRTLFGRQYPVDISDLLAAVREGKKITGLLDQALQFMGGLQYISPVVWPEDVREAEREGLRQLLEELAGSGRFEEIILDVGQDLACPETLLACCDRIYRPQKEDAFSLAKLEEYDAYLAAGGWQAVRERTRPIPLGELSGDIPAGRLDQWQRWEGMIPFVRRILEEETDG